MTDTTARLRRGSKIFETMVNLESAMKLRRGEAVGISEVSRDNAIYTNLKSGMRAASKDLEEAFGTSDFLEIVKKIVEKGELEVTQEFRDEALEKKRRQIVDFLTKNGIDARTNRPFTADMIESAMKQAGVKIDNQTVEKQIGGIIETLKKAIPIKIETKKIKIKIPSQHTGKVYGLLQEYREKETWLGSGDLEVILNIPVGLQSDFYDKLNSVTHGSAITEEIRE
ncbi:MAG: ribosome assembly factor SBDS [Candidatus Pacearchaeota archaeon]